MDDSCTALSEKEKDTLRLMVRGHDAKSMANELSLSVHTINERLRSARRKLGVTSSREAARLLFESEGGTYENLVGNDLGEAGEGEEGQTFDVTRTFQSDRRGAGRLGALIFGVCVMSALAAVLLMTTPLAQDDAASSTATAAARNDALEKAASEWLALLDERDWEGSYAATASSFREANTLQLWSDTATIVQDDLGETVSRELLGIDEVPSPQGITIVRYRTDYANKKGMTETLSMVREDDVWKVAGIYVS